MIKTWWPLERMNSAQKVVGVLGILGNSRDLGSGRGKELELSPIRANWHVRFGE
jgi:hypothetical protein